MTTQEKPRSASMQECTETQLRNNKMFIVFIIVGLIVGVLGDIIIYSSSWSFSWVLFEIGVVVGEILAWLGWLTFLLGWFFFIFSCYAKRIVHGVGKGLEEATK